MLRSTLHIVLTAVLVLALIAPAAHAAGGGGIPQGAGTVGDSAAGAYNRGLKYRDKAWELQEELEAVTGEDREKIAKKIRKEYDKAIRAFRTAAKADPYMHQAHSSLGYALRKSGRYEEALASYNQALELKPTYTEAIEYRAEAFLGLDRLEEAKEAYMQLFRTDRARADELIEAMQEWVEARTVDPQQLSAGVVDDFAGWVAERQGLAKQTASLGGATGSSWD